MKTLNITLYSFSELSETAQENTIALYAEDINDIIFKKYNQTLTEIDKLFLKQNWIINRYNEYFLIYLKPYGEIKINDDFTGELFNLFLNEYVIENIEKFRENQFDEGYTNKDIISAFWSEYEKPINERKSYKEFISFLKNIAQEEFKKWKLSKDNTNDENSLVHLKDYQKKWLCKIFPENIFMEDGSIFNFDKDIFLKNLID